MNRLSNLQQNLAPLPQLDAHQFKTLVFGPNYPMREKAFEVMRSTGMLHHYHITEDSKEEVRHKTLRNVFLSRGSLKQSIEQTEENTNMMSLFGNGFIYYDLGFTIRSGVHFYLYMKAIQFLGTDQHRSLLEDGYYIRDIGCFGLTELTHGSNVKGIKTEAHYDHATQQFVIHTPTKEAMKFWIGGAAQTANMSVIWAQLYIGDKCHGVHAYVVPIRDRQTHKLLPGVLIGDCGPKNGLNGIDNGFIILDRVRIPKKHQLDRISGVDDNGKFRTIVENDDKRFGLHLSALSGGRYMISNNCCVIATQAVTIGIRYCHERRQFKIGKNSQQSPLINYPLTKRRMMPLLAQTLVYYTASMTYLFEWDSNQKNILDPTHPAIEKLHAISSVLKAKTSWFASQCARECREMLGGHGYSSYSKLGTLFNDNDVNLTWQGDNHVLIQQTSKYVLEEVQKILQKGKKTNNPLLFFLQNPPSDPIECTESSLTDLQKGISFLQFKLLRKIEQTGMNMLQLKQKKLPIMDIWNNSQIFLGRQVALLYGDLSILTTLVHTISQCKHAPNRLVFQTCTKLWLLTLYRKDEFIQLKHHPLIQSLISSLSHQLSAYSLQLLSLISTDDDIIGSFFADPQGRGIQKYLDFILSKPTNTRPEWWELLITR